MNKNGLTEGTKCSRCGFEIDDSCDSVEYSNTDVSHRIDHCLKLTQRERAHFEAMTSPELLPSLRKQWAEDGARAGVKAAKQRLR
jgi:hypothetical protein